MKKLFHFILVGVMLLAALTASAAAEGTIGSNGNAPMRPPAAVKASAVQRSLELDIDALLQRNDRNDTILKLDINNINTRLFRNGSWDIIGFCGIENYDETAEQLNGYPQWMIFPLEQSACTFTINKEARKSSVIMADLESIDNGVYKNILVCTWDDQVAYCIVTLEIISFSATITDVEIGDSYATFRWESDSKSPYSISLFSGGLAPISINSYSGNTYTFTDLLPEQSYQFVMIDRTLNGDGGLQTSFTTQRCKATFVRFPVSLLTADILPFQNQKPVEGKKVSAEALMNSAQKDEYCLLVRFDTSKIKYESCRMKVGLYAPDLTCLAYWVKDIHLEGNGRGSWYQWYNTAPLRMLAGRSIKQGTYTVKVWFDDAYVGKDTFEIGR